MRYRCSWALLVLALVVLCLAPAYASPAAPVTANRLVIVSWDAAADWIMDRLVAQGKMPNMAKLAREGVRADYVVPPFPSITAPSHAALWTATTPDLNGITYNSVSILPKSEHTVLETMSGFDSTPLLDDPIWMSVVTSGRRAIVLSATQSVPIDGYYAKMTAAGIPKGHLNAIAGRFGGGLPFGIYSHPDAISATEPAGLPPHTGPVRSLNLSMGDSPFQCFFFDAKSDPKKGFDTAIIESMDGESVVLKPGWSKPGTTDKFSSRINVKLGNTTATVRFRLFALSSDGSSFLLYHTAAKTLAFTTPVTYAFPFASGGEGEVPFWDYKAGKLGKPLWENGDGSAERRLIELVRLAVSQFRAETRIAMKSWQWNLIMHYSPFPDAFEHIMTAYIDPKCHAYRPDLAKKLWPYLEQLYRIHDEWIGDMLAARPKDCIVAVVSDHGMQGVSRSFYTNAVLKSVGLLAVDENGKIDLSKTKALAPPWYLAEGIVINDTSWKGGIVRPEDKRAVQAAAEEAIRNATDPDTGVRPVTKIYESPSRLLSLGGPRTVDFAFDLQRDYCPEDDLSPVVAGAAKLGSGMHGFVPWRPMMHSIFYASGPGLKTGRVLPGMPATEVIPTLCKALGWPVPNASLRATKMRQPRGP